MNVHAWGKLEIEALEAEEGEYQCRRPVAVWYEDIVGKKGTRERERVRERDITISLRPICNKIRFE